MRNGLQKRFWVRRELIQLHSKREIYFGFERFKIFMESHSTTD